MARGSSKRNGNKVPSAAPATRVVLYARVSTKDQEREGFSVPAQERLLRDYAATHGLVIAKEFVDVETAKRAGRTNFVAMMSWLKKHKETCKTVLVEKTDRLYRNLKDWVTLDGLDLEIHLVKEGIVLSDDSRSAEKFMHGIRVLMAKNYIDNLSEEATKGMREKARQGIWPSRAPIGYVNVQRDDGKKVIKPDPDRAPLVTKMFEWAATGEHSLSALVKRARQAGLTMKKSGKPLLRATLHRVLHNPLYKGDVEWDGETFPGIHEALVSPELWDRVQEALDSRYQHQRHGQDRHRQFAYAGLLTCGHCGCAMSGQVQKERYVYYHCTGFRGNCGEPYVREERLSEAFSSTLARLTIPGPFMDWLREALRRSHADERAFHEQAVERLEKDCAKLQRRIDQAYLDKLDGVIDAEFFERHASAWRDEQRRLRRTILRHEDANQSYIEEGILLLELATEAHGLFENQPPEQRRRLLNYVLSNSAWAGGELATEWRQPFDIIAEIADGARGEDPPEPGDSEGVSRMVTPRGFEPRLPGWPILVIPRESADRKSPLLSVVCVGALDRMIPWNLQVCA